MTAGYQGSASNDPLDNTSANKHSALSGSDFSSGINEEHPEANARLEDKIREHLIGHTEVDSTRVKISVKEGFVALTGFVDSLQSKATVQGLVEAVRGVVDVANFLEIDSRNISGNDDMMI